LVPPLWGVDVSCRTAVIYCPTDMSAYWELDRLGREHEFSDAVRENLRAARQIGINVLTYATGRQVEFKNPALPTVIAADSGSVLDRGTLQVANVLHPGGCHAAPAALRNLLRRAGNDFGLAVSREPREVSLAGDDLFQFHVLFMHGRTSFELTPLERTQLRGYLERGGTLIADAVCSSEAFTKSFRREMQEIFPERPLSTLPADDPILTPAFGGEDVSKVSRRRLKSLLSGVPGPAATYNSSPELEAVRLQDRYAVIFSPLDISCALESEPVGCTGYVRRDATRIAINLLLYALNQ
jgi:hypothetical protein